MGYSFLMPLLAQGSKPEDGAQLYGLFDTVVLCAAEHQDITLPGVEVIHAPFEDRRYGPAPTAAEIQIAWTAAHRVVRRVKSGRRVLITCAMGWNRSGLVMGMVLILLGLTAKQAVAAIRMARGSRALHNRFFVKLLEAIPPGPPQVFQRSA